MSLRARTAPSEQLPLQLIQHLPALPQPGDYRLLHIILLYILLYVLLYILVISFVSLLCTYQAASGN